jgi:GNAT superfamily N-acetyltransferase
VAVIEESQGMTSAQESGPQPLADLRFTLATRDDGAVALRLLNEACAWVRSKGIVWVRRYPRQCVVEAIERREFFLVSVASRPVATFILTEQSDPYWEGHPGRALYLHALSVSREDAGQGLGRRILDWATETAGRRGMQYLRLDCSAANGRLRQYYLDAGFTLVGSHPKQTWPALFQRETSEDGRVHG